MAMTQQQPTISDNTTDISGKRENELISLLEETLATLDRRGMWPAARRVRTEMNRILSCPS